MAVDDSLRDRVARPRPVPPGEIIRDFRSRGPGPDRGHDGGGIADAVPPETEDESAPLPLKGGDYLAFTKSRNKAELMLCLVKRDSSCEALAYSDLRWVTLQPSGEPGKGPVLVLRFIGVAEVRMEGRNLDTLVDEFRRHRIGWCCELATEDYFDDHIVVIRKIGVTALE